MGPAISVTHIVDACVAASSLSDLDQARRLATIMSEPPELFRFVEKLLFALVPRATSENLTSGSRREGDTYVVQFGRSHRESFALEEEVAMLPESLVPIVAFILDLDPFWQVKSNMLNVFGLPHNRRELRALYLQSGGGPTPS